MTFMSLEFLPIVRNEMDKSRGGVQHASHFTCGNCHEFLLLLYRKRSLDTLREVYFSTACFYRVIKWMDINPHYRL